MFTEDVKVKVMVTAFVTVDLGGRVQFSEVIYSDDSMGAFVPYMPRCWSWWIVEFSGVRSNLPPGTLKQGTMLSVLVYFFLEFLLFFLIFSYVRK